ncbi:hypothetical protein ACWT_4112 [Actinoplanes sp. SE50]|nr:hypothetical protein ACPL_4241 [Actinoplanes sp. SE50/110]ATO83527.1 hypothetical protein ACWT_4112 [Actinoplanes sp. SE50]SLM00934.1 hypothetical protein ACSP50_4167 [Actinoplanes sp. SE50/110]
MVSGMTLVFPGPRLGGLSLIAGPPLLLAGTALRLGVPFFFPHQIAAYQQRPGLWGTSYALALAGIIALWPGIAMLAAQIADSRPGWGRWGGTLVITGLFARVFQHGADTFAFSLTGSAGPVVAEQAVGAYYRYPEWVVSSLSVAIMTGWIVLAVGGRLSRVLRAWQAVALALMSGLMIGVLKGSTVASVVEVAGLAVALVPHGVTCLRGAGLPGWRTLGLVVLTAGASIILGQLG